MISRPALREDRRIEAAYTGHMENIRTSFPYMNIDDMSVPERIRDKVAHAYLEWIYKQFIPEDVIDRFGIDNVIEAYGATNDVKTLMDTRIIKCTYARLVGMRVIRSQRCSVFRYRR